MTENQSSYRQIFKATSLFGGVQIFQIIVGIIRTKLVAVILGAAGVGIMGLLNAPLQLIISVTGLGISYSAVRDIGEAHGRGDQSRISYAITILRRWSWFTGFLGAIVTITIAPLLSQWTFGNRDYAWSFVWLSVTLLFQALSKGQNTILQGTRRLKEMARSGVIGSALGLFTSIPLYYWLGIKGIVPAMVLSALTALILSWYYSRKVIIQDVSLTIRETYKSGLGMARLGIYMTVAGFIASFSIYILNAFISNKGGIEQVGFYNAGWGVVGQYTGIIFSAMATDYFPRLSAVQADDEKVKELVQQQAVTALLIIGPLLALLIAAMPIVVRILYTPAFTPVVMFASLTLLGIQFKAISWSMGYVYLAKGNGSLFLKLEIISGLAILGFNLFLYYLLGLNGLGISFVVSYFLAIILSYLVLKVKYNFRFSGKFYLIFFLTYGFVVLAFLTVFIESNYIRYALGAVIFLLAALASLYQLNQLLDLRSLIRGRFRN